MVAGGIDDARLFRFKVEGWRHILRCGGHKSHMQGPVLGRGLEGCLRHVARLPAHGNHRGWPLLHQIAIAIVEQFPGQVAKAPPLAG